MRKKFTLLIASLALLLGSSTVWGQIYPNTVNNEFGAGESAKITTGSHTSQNVTNPPLLGGYSGISYTYGAFNHSLSASPVPDIQIGSATGENTVIRTYTGDGFAMGWISVLNKTPALGESSSPSWPDPDYFSNLPTAGSYMTPTAFSKNNSRPIYEFSFNKFNFGNYTPANWATNQPPCGLPVFTATLAPGGGGSSIITVNHHIGASLSGNAFPSPAPTDLYTSTIDAIHPKTYPMGYYNDFGPTTYNFPLDDGIDLVQFNGLTMTSGLALAGQTPLISDKTVPDGNLTTKLANYKRPTTLIIEAGGHIFDKINIADVKWQYQGNQVVADPTFLGNLNNCNTGASSAYRFDVSWTASSTTAQTLVDGAIRLSSDALVCVENNTSDATTNPASIHTSGSSPDDETDAIVVLPNATSGRFTLRTKGNFAKMNLTHDLTNADVYYGQATFPTPHANVYMYPSTTSSSHSFATPLLNGYNGSLGSGTITSITQPATTATSSIFGVHGDYIFVTNNADIHTTAAGTPTGATGADNNPGVIEVGPVTAGKTHFHVYSGGILKNFESCTTGANFAMQFGQRFGGTPNVYLDQDNDLNILNYGNYGSKSCPADIYFGFSAIDTIANAFSVATGNGAFRVQALSDVEVRSDATIDATSRGNNLYLLSDGGNVVTQKFDITSDYVNNIGQGQFTLWAEDGTPAGSDFSTCGNNYTANRNSVRGNIFLNDAVAITRAGAVAGTETNLVAANNIRTASVDVRSTSTVNDSVNVISRKGDIYLGYSLDADVYDTSDGIVQNGLLDYDDNMFTFAIQDVANAGALNIKAGYDDAVDSKQPYEGGNIYFTSLNATMLATGTYPTNIMIPFSNEYLCGTSANNDSVLHRRDSLSMQHYEHAGIIGGVGRNGKDGDWSLYAGKLGNATESTTAATNLSLDYKANKGNLTVDAGTRGNIIMNTGSSLDFQGDAGNGFFRTRYGDIDMRGETNATNLNSSLLFLASSDEANKWITGVCGCNEQRNNVYLQDFQYTNGSTHNGSVFVGADNNIKLNYGGLTNRATQADPFLSKEYDKRYNWGTPYNGNYHCDLNPTINQARNLTLNFTSVNGGFAAVASDRIDVYKPLIYNGGTGTGMSAVPGQSSLQGENVAGYGLYMKTTSAKNSWTYNGLDGKLPKCPFSCAIDDCSEAALHNIVRMTFHDDARIIANNQRVLLASPVIESFGHMELDVANGAGSKTAITIQADSLIFHDSLILSETLTNKVNMTAWTSSLKTPILKLGYKRTSPPVQEIIYDVNGNPFKCNDCVTHTKGDPKSKLDTMVVVFKKDASFERFESTIVDHTVITFLTDSFDHVDKGLIQDARIYTNLFKVRNQVEFWRDAARTKDGHFELISEQQMFSKDYAGVYTRHLHMEPIGACGRPYSDLWLCDPALDVITTSTFGGYGTIHADVHVEIEAKLAPGYASLGLRGNCYEQKAGTLSMENLRLDKGAQIHYTIGDVLGFDGEYTDCVQADEITLYGDVFISIEKRACERYEPGCYPIIRYNTVAIGESNLNNLKLKTKSIDGVPLALDTSTPGVVYLCVGDGATVSINREVHIPQVPGVTLITPAKFGYYYIGSYGNFYFKVKYDSEPPLKVTTNRIINGVTEELIGKKNANGEYEYVIGRVQQNISLKFGPEYATDNIEIVDGKAVWSHGSTIYIRVEKEDIASIYSIAGQLVKRVELSEGSTPIPMTRGIYIVTLIDGSVHKVILK